jgi:hypothetical protein
MVFKRHINQLRKSEVKTTQKKSVSFAPEPIRKRFDNEPGKLIYINESENQQQEVQVNQEEIQSETERTSSGTKLQTTVQIHSPPMFEDQPEEVQVQVQPEVQIRRSNRRINPPAYLHDYIVDADEINIDNSK